MLVNIHKKPSTNTVLRPSLNPFADEFQMPTQKDASPVIAQSTSGPIKCNQNAVNVAMSDNRVAAVENDFSPEAYKINQINDVEPNASPSVANNATAKGGSEKLLNECIPKEPSDAVTVLTKKELAELYEEPLNTSNAMVAIMGYDPKDDERICLFYNPRTGKCFKGNNCRFEHVQIMKGM